MVKVNPKNSKKRGKGKSTVDFAATADSFASDQSGHEDVNGSGSSQASDGAEEYGSESNEGEGVEDSELDSSDDNDNEEEEEDGEEDDEDEDEEEDVTAIFKGARASENNDRSAKNDAENSDEMRANEPHFQPPIAQGNDQCSFDLKNLLAVNSHQIASSSLYVTKKSRCGDEEKLTIPLSQGHDVGIDEDFLLSMASKNCAQLVDALWQLPTETSDAGPLVQLPAHDEVKIPRALPPPAPREETKWEKFAKAKGIPLNKEKRSRKVFDEASGTWMYRTGYEKANNKSKEWPIMEVGATDDPYADPWEKLRDAKRARTDKNMENRMKNEERAGNLAKGTTNRVMKSRERSREIGKAGGNLDRTNLPPTGVPVDLKSGTNASSKRGKVSTVAALEAVQRSTASLGKFDKMREGEPERRKTLSKMKKRKLETATDKKVISSEREKSMKILNSVMNGGGATKEKAIRKGAFAKGETPYDYDFDDGLGASAFKKKKGRGGVGKMKKMTKKRAK